MNPIQDDDASERDLVRMFHGDEHGDECRSIEPSRDHRPPGRSITSDRLVATIACAIIVTLTPVVAVDTIVLIGWVKG